MRPTPFYFFFHQPPGAKKPKRTTYRMTIEDAAVRLPGAWPDELSKEIRNLPDDGDLVNGGMGFLATAAAGFKPCPAEIPAADAAEAQVAPRALGS